ncbi:MAG: metal-dependent hydrolase [Thermoguttaceae bacterium]
MASFGFRCPCGDAASEQLIATLYSHAVVGLGLGRLYADRPMPWTYWGIVTLLPMVPDLDVFSVAAYGSPLGHRGITHSLLFAGLLGAATAALCYRRFRVRWWSLASLLLAIIASHGLLDAMTWGGETVPFFWPLGGRYGNWGPLPVSDVGIDLSDLIDSRAIRAELLWLWLPTIAAVSIKLLYDRFAQRRMP